MNAWVFLHEASKFGRHGGLIPGIRFLQASLELNEKIAKKEIAAGRISSPDFYSEEIRRYEDSALASSRLI